jgi:hypothetical protein
MAIVGLSGARKTQIALEFAYAMKKTRPNYFVFRLPALSMESFKQACAEITRTLGLAQTAEDKEDMKKLVRRYLSAETAGQWLLIINNAGDVKILFGSEQVRDIADYLPHSEDCLLIFTIRTQEAAVALAGRDVVKLQTMSRQEAVDFSGRC